MGSIAQLGQYSCTRLLVCMQRACHAVKQTQARKTEPNQGAADPNPVHVLRATILQFNKHTSYKCTSDQAAMPLSTVCNTAKPPAFPCVRSDKKSRTSLHLAIQAAVRLSDCVDAVPLLL